MEDLGCTCLSSLASRAREVDALCVSIERGEPDAVDALRGVARSVADFAAARGLEAVAASARHVEGASVEAAVRRARGLARELERVAELTCRDAGIPCTTLRPGEATRPGVLLASADASSVEALLPELEAECLDVRRASDGPSTLALALDDAPALVLLDAELPSSGGLELLRRLRGIPSLASVPIVVLTARASSDEEVRALDLGADSYTEKLSAPSTLAARLRRLVRRAADDSPDATPRVAGEFEDAVALVHAARCLVEQRATGVLRVRGASGTGELALRDGVVVAAATPGFDGDDALHAIFVSGPGRYELVPRLSPGVVGHVSFDEVTAAILSEADLATVQIGRPGARSPLPSGAAALLVGQLVDGKYEIRKVLGEGGMGVVYEARHILLDVPIALKIVHPRLVGNATVRERFIREARSTLAFRHPNAIAVRDCGMSGGGLYLAMDYSPGVSLRSLIAKEGRFTVGRALRLVRQCLLALGEAHGHGIVHRDVKPDNVLVERDAAGAETARLCDFGIAKRTEAASSGAAADLTGAWIVGSPAYIAPEQAKGEAIDGRADVYATGALLYELLTGTRVFSARSPLELLDAQIREAPEPPSRRAPDLPPELDALVLGALEKDVEKRYATAEEFVEAIDLAGKALGIVTPGTGTRRAGRPGVDASPAERSHATPASVLAVVACLGSNELRSFLVEPGGGLRPLGRATSTRGSPVAIATHAAKGRVFAAYDRPGVVSTFAFDATTCKLDPSGEPVRDGVGPVALAIHPSGRFLFVANEASNDVGSLAIDAGTGTLEPSGPRAAAGAAPRAIAVHPSGRFVYVTNGRSNDVSCFAADAGTGRLTPLPFRPQTGAKPRSIALHASGRHAWVVGAHSDDVQAFGVDEETGELFPLGEPVATGAEPLWIAVARGGSFALVACGRGGCVAVHRVREDGTLAPAEREVAVGGVPCSIAVDPRGGTACVARHGTHDVLCLALDEQTGELSNAEAPAGAGRSPFAIAMLELVPSRSSSPRVS